MKEVKKILVPVDFSQNVKVIVDSARYLAEKLSAGLAFVFVVQSLETYNGFFVPTLPLDKLEGDMLLASQKKMEDFITETLGEESTCEFKVGVGDIAEEILAYAEDVKADMIVMGTHGYKGLERVLFGSIAEKVVKNSPCPVLTINPYRV